MRNRHLPKVNTLEQTFNDSVDFLLKERKYETPSKTKPLLPSVRRAYGGIVKVGELDDLSPDDPKMLNVRLHAAG